MEFFFLSSAKSRGRVFLPVLGEPVTSTLLPFLSLTIDCTNLIRVWLCLVVPSHTWTMKWMHSSAQSMKIGISIRHNKHNKHCISTRQKKIPSPVQREVSCCLCCSCPPAGSQKPFFRPHTLRSLYQKRQGIRSVQHYKKIHSGQDGKTQTLHCFPLILKIISFDMGLKKLSLRRHSARKVALSASTETW